MLLMVQKSSEHQEETLEVPICRKWSNPGGFLWGKINFSQENMGLVSLESMDFLSPL